MSVGDAKLKLVGKEKEEQAIMKAVRQVEGSLIGEGEAAQTAAEKQCTDDQAAEVKLAPFKFHGRSMNMVVGCEKDSRCASLMSTEQQELTALATTIDSNKASATAKTGENTQLAAQNEADKDKMQKITNEAKAATEKHGAAKANIANAIRVLTQM